MRNDFKGGGAAVSRGGATWGRDRLRVCACVRLTRMGGWRKGSGLPCGLGRQRVDIGTNNRTNQPVYQFLLLSCPTRLGVAFHSPSSHHFDSTSSRDVLDGLSTPRQTQGSHLPDRSPPGMRYMRCWRTTSPLRTHRPSGQ